MTESNSIEYKQELTDNLLDRVVSILEQARSNVVRAINSNMVVAYWLIGREIVQALQGGEERAEYGKQVIAKLSEDLNRRYGKGFSTSNLWYFRQFYQAYPGNLRILHPLGGELAAPEKLFPAGGESVPAFSPQLSWSHYRVLMRVENLEARRFYEQEAIEGGWDKRTLERQTSTQYYERCLSSQQPNKLIAEGRQLQKTASSAADILKNPYVLEFLGYPDFAELRESDIERAIITHLQRFLLELGNGFAFVARQKHIRIEEDDRFIDLVFYHCRQKFYLLIDLKLGKLSHADVGQMDGYVRMFDGLFTAPDDNPTIGLILCTEKCDTVARYSVLNDRKQKYMLCLPSEEQLKREIERERKLIEAAIEGESHE
ncbi:MAG: hypothetical protein RIR18_1727 [Pseudomonadota bacterium]|jgi:predicted nuclease of restriction endonuclease-like (RecB) superfamily